MILIKRFIFIVNTLLTILFLTVVPGLTQEFAPQFQPPHEGPDFVPGEVLVKFQPNVTIFGAQSSLRADGLLPLEVSPRSGLLRVQVEPGRETETIAALLARGDVKIASYNHIFQASIQPDDPSYSNQWALPKIEAPSAWDIYTGNSDVVVAVVDSGLDTAHGEFDGRIVDPRDEIDGDNTPQDTCGHGTHVTGIIAAKGNNTMGVAGVAWDVSILPVRALTLNGSCSGSEFDIQAGIDWALGHGAKIINLSLGALPPPGETCEQAFPVMSSAVKDAHNAGVLVVAASGNNAQNRLVCPGLQLEAMAVGSTTSSDSRSSFSNYGSQLAVVAPGSRIYSTTPGNNYGNLSGTSMAAPHVAGLAALIWSFAPSLAESQVGNIIQNTADDLGPAGWDQFYGYGRINARQAMEAVSLQTAPLTLLIDGDKFPVSGSIEITTLNPDVITWTTVISPSVGWLNLVTPGVGSVSAASSPVRITLVATRPFTYGTYSTTLIITGTTSSGAQFVKTDEVHLTYTPEVYEYHIPMIFKN